VEGLQVEGGWLSPEFVNEPYSRECRLDNPYILLLDKKLSAFRDLIPFFEQVYKQGRSILTIAESVEGEALATMVLNYKKNRFLLCAVKAPGHAQLRRELLEDIAALTGATVICQELGLRLQDIKLEHLGTCGRAVAGEFFTTLTGGCGGSRLEERVKVLRSAVEGEREQMLKERLQARLASLSGGIAVIRCGGMTDIEAEERRFRVEDSLHAARAALEKGIVPGGGIAILRAGQAVIKGIVKGPRDFVAGHSIACEAMFRPFKAIARNAGCNEEEFFKDVLSGEEDWGYDAVRGEWGYLCQMGVVDPLQVVLTALRSAASVASLVLLTESAIVMPVGQ